MLADKEVEFIINLTIPNVHYQVSKSILESKNILIQKNLFLLNLMMGKN